MPRVAVSERRCVWVEVAMSVLPPPLRVHDSREDALLRVVVVPALEAVAHTDQVGLALEQRLMLQHQASQEDTDACVCVVGVVCEGGRDVPSSVAAPSPWWPVGVRRHTQWGGWWWPG